MEKQVVIGTIIAPHGVRGDIRILPQTDHPEQFLELSSLAKRGRGDLAEVITKKI